MFHKGKGYSGISVIPYSQFLYIATVNEYLITWLTNQCIDFHLAHWCQLSWKKNAYGNNTTNYSVRWLADIQAERGQWKQGRKGTRRSRGYSKVYIFVHTVASNMAFAVLFKPTKLWDPHLYSLNRNNDYVGLWWWIKWHVKSTGVISGNVVCLCIFGSRCFAI